MAVTAVSGVDARRPIPRLRRLEDERWLALALLLPTAVLLGLSEAAWLRLQASDGDNVTVRHADPVESLGEMRRRIYGHRLDGAALRAIVSDIVDGRYSDVHLAAFVTACAALPLDGRETVELTRVMVEVGERLSWPGFPIVDKHYQEWRSKNLPKWQPRQSAEKTTARFLSHSRSVL
jgi:hypothetical protein